MAMRKKNTTLLELGVSIISTLTTWTSKLLRKVEITYVGLPVHMSWFRGESILEAWRSGGFLTAESMS